MRFIIFTITRNSYSFIHIRLLFQTTSKLPRMFVFSGSEGGASADLWNLSVPIYSSKNKRLIKTNTIKFTNLNTCTHIITRTSQSLRFMVLYVLVREDSLALACTCLWDYLNYLRRFGRLLYACVVSVLLQPNHCSIIA